jgi:hypothetical protein
MQACSVILRRALLSCLLAFCTFIYSFSQQGSRIPEVEKANTAALVSPAPVNPVAGSGSIRFATAFRWNKSGPTGGYWSDNEINDEIFRPVYVNVASYRLLVFNRNGYKVFESSELYKGWDGYLSNGERAMQGVYIWKATGTFTDGTSFSKTGDVTYIY